MFLAGKQAKLELEGTHKVASNRGMGWVNKGVTKVVTHQVIKRLNISEFDTGEVLELNESGSMRVSCGHSISV